MRKSFGLITLLFLIALPFILLLSIIPLTILNLYLRRWKKESECRVDVMNSEQKKGDYTKTRMNQIIPLFREILPKDAKSALDIGSGRDMKEKFIKEFFTKYISLDIKNADINQDISLKSKIPLKDNSVDIVIMSNILEHLADPLPIIYEANRVAKKYIMIGLPNEYPLDSRLFTLFGMYYDKIYPLGHKHKLSVSSIEGFIKSLFGSYLSKKYKFKLMGSRFLPYSIQRLLMKNFPGLFIGEVFYIIKKGNLNKKNILYYENA